LDHVSLIQAFFHIITHCNISPLFADKSEGISLDDCLRELFNERQVRPHNALNDAINVYRICDKATELLGAFSSYQEVIIDYDHNFTITSILERAVGVDRKNAIQIVENAVYLGGSEHNTHFEGEIDNWIADRGFGFIRPTTADTLCLGTIFVHFTAFNQSVDSMELERGQRVLFGLNINTDYENERQTRYKAHSVTLI